MGEEGKSEFGRGVVICLAKFSEHLFNPSAVTVMNEIQGARLSPQQREIEQAEARQYPHGDAAQQIASRMYSGFLGDLVTDPISQALERWANGASDHFYDLNADLAPAPLKELAELTLSMGHGFTGRRWSEADWDRIHDLWEAACLALDQRFGVKDPDWGEW